MSTYPVVIIFMRLSITTTFNPKSKSNLSERMQSAIDFAIRKAALRVQNEAKELMPIRTGRLRSSFTATANPGGIDMKWTAPYAEDVNFGATPHIILPKAAQVLKFQMGGKTVFAKRVNHPGFQGRFFSMNVGSLASQILNEELMLSISKVRTL